MSEASFLEKLLDGAEVEWFTLGDMAKVGTGNSNRQDESDSGAYPFYVRSKNVLRSDTFQFDETAIIVPGEGGIGDIFHYVEGKYALHQRAYRIHVISERLNTKFLYYFMHSSFKRYILMKSVGATSISIRKPMLENFQIPIPCPDDPKKSLDIQAEIVRIRLKASSRWSFWSVSSRMAGWAGSWNSRMSVRVMAAMLFNATAGIFSVPFS